APEHPFAQKVAAGQYKPAEGASQAAKVAAYIKKTQAKSEIERQEEGRKKTGAFTGFYVKNPLTGRDMPVWVSDFVLAGFGTGALVGVPAHDRRDFEFATEFGLDIVRVVKGADGDTSPVTEISQVQEEQGTMVNSGFLDGMDIHQATVKMMDYMTEKGYGERKVTYRLRDWIFSRQHYWGEPIPIIHCPKDGAVAVPAEQLPVILPKVEHYEPTDTGESPLAEVTDWVNTKCPTCGGPAKRETDTMPNWAGSSWYYLRYMDAHNDEAFASREAMEYWGMADLYLGGMEHTTLHLLYSRFWHQFFYDEGLVPTPEPYAARRGQGIVLAADGRKMSKSIGNVVNPTDIIANYGADTLRLYIMFMAPYDETTPWSEERLGGASRFVYKVWTLAQELMEAHNGAPKGMAQDDDAFTILVDRTTHKAIKRVHDDLGAMHFNTAVAGLMEYVNFLSSAKTKLALFESANAAVAWRSLRTLILLLAPMTPHLAEELWNQLGETGSVHIAGWPKYDPNLIKDDVITVIVQVNGKVRANLIAAPDVTDAELEAAAKADPKAAKFLEGQHIVKTIVIPRKVVNFVVR
ncbi:MAG TPA: class I tRNA ligase family protein, partial [Candidatus Saccharimonadia bacterium]|nr:class I tRNA ligase family protein [Candidatus Saccharimonadia bacterium]